MYLKEYARKRFDSSGGQLSIREKSHLLSVYSPHQLLEMSATLLVQGKEIDLRTRLDILMGHFMLLRSQNRLESQLADVYMRPQYNKGVRGDQNLLMLLLQKGKVVSSYV
jgi:hypothetical protein